jgi:hypothetical protein
MTTEKFTLIEKIDIRKVELKMLKDVEILKKASTHLYKQTVRDIHLRCFLRKILKKSKWNIFKFIFNVNIRFLLSMRKDDKFMIESYWMAKKNLKIAEELDRSLQNPCF